MSSCITTYILSKGMQLVTKYFISFSSHSYLEVQGGLNNREEFPQE